MARYEDYGPSRGGRGADYETERGYRGPDYDYERGHRGPDYERGSRGPDYDYERGYRGSHQGRNWEQGPSYWGGYSGGWGPQQGGYYSGGGWGPQQGGHAGGWSPYQAGYSGGWSPYQGGYPGGWGSYQGGGTYGRGFYGRSGQYGARSDEEIRNELYDVLDDDPQIPYDADIDVEVNDGIVTLKGQVRSRYIKMAAGNAAWMTPGVEDVNNNLKVTGRRRAAMGAGTAQSSTARTTTAGATTPRTEAGTTSRS